jgi:hypothetical protein
LELTDKKKQVAMKLNIKKMLTALSKFGLCSPSVECFFDLYFLINKEDNSKIYPVILIDQLENPYDLSFPSLYMYLVSEDMDFEINLFNKKNDKYYITQSQTLPINVVKKSELKFDHLVFNGKDLDNLELEMTKVYKKANGDYLYNILDRFNKTMRNSFDENMNMINCKEIIIDDRNILEEINSILVEKNEYILIGEDDKRVQIFRQLCPFPMEYLELNVWTETDKKDGNRTTVHALQHIPNIQLGVFYRYVDIWDSLFSDKEMGEEAYE